VNQIDDELSQSGGDNSIEGDFRTDQDAVLAQFDYHLNKQVHAEDIGLPDHELLELVIRDLVLDYISRHAIRVQKYYMRRCLFMGPTTTVQQLVERLNDLNKYLLYFPEEHTSQLKQDEIIEIWTRPKPQNGMKPWFLPTLTFFK
jgi:hypothetical protein